MMDNNGINKRPMFSVISATFNVVSDLPRLIGSLRRQSDRGFEWIVADGASNDGTIDLLRSVDDLNIIILSQSDFGIYDALNRAIRAASGDYYIVLGADDFLEPDAISNFRCAVDESDADMITADVRYCGRRIGLKRGWPWLCGHAALITAHSVGTAFKKDMHRQYGFYSNRFPIAADQLFVMQASQSGASCYKSGFVAGVVGDEGVSSQDRVGNATEVFRVQVCLGRSKFIQTVLLMLRLLKALR